jgi:hypothetical protein
MKPIKLVLIADQMMIRLRVADVLEASQSREVHQEPAAHFVSLSTQVLTILRELHCPFVHGARHLLLGARYAKRPTCENMVNASLEASASYLLVHAITHRNNKMKKAMT